jgi:predicted permease
MRPLQAWLSRLRGLFSKERRDRELTEELESHLQMHVEDNLRRGMSPEEARREAIIRLGGIEQTKESYRDRRGLPVLETLLEDLRYGLRTLLKSPGFTAVVVLSLALGIGANTAIFTLINAALLKMLPVTDPERLVTIGCSADDSFPYPAFKQLRDSNRVFSGVLAFRRLDTFDFEVDGHPGLAKGQVVSGNYYSLLGVNAILGRTITPQDDKVAGGAPVAVISYGYWAKRFNREPSAIGKKVVLNGSPFTIIGVTPPEFFGLEPGDPVEVSIPISMVGQVASGWAAAGTPYSVLSAPFRNWLHLMGRLKAGVTEARALANVDPIYRQAMREAAEGLPSSPFGLRMRELFLQTRLHLEPGGKGLAALRQKFSKPLLILMAVVGLLLLIACANVASLMLARASARQREMAVRTALGAGRLRLIRQLITESVLLALAGGVCGLLLAYRGSSALLHLMSQASSPISLNVQPDVRVLSFTALVSLFTAILFGLAPAMRSTQLEMGPALKDDTRSLGGARSRSRLGKALVVAQVALSLVLLIGAGLLVRSLEKLKNFYPGFNVQHVLLFSVNPGMVGYKEAQVIGLYQRLLAGIKAIPGLRAASFSVFTPLGTGFSNTLPTVERYRPRPGEYAWVRINIIGPGYFKVLETPVLLGREFTEADAAGAAKVAVINQAMAHYYFGDTNPLGRRFSLPGWKGDASWLEIVGVIQDARNHSLREQTPPEAYIPFLQSPESGSVTLELRTTADPGRLTAAVRRAVQETDGRLPVFDVKTLTEQVDESLVQERLVASLSSLFGVLALELASIGLYGLMAYTVTRRTNEIGLRMALGAQRAQILGMIMRETLLLVAVGLGIGVPAAIGASRLIASELYGLGPGDPLTVSMATFVMLGVAALSGYLPARRASRVDPMVALRYE